MSGRPFCSRGQKEIRGSEVDRIVPSVGEELFGIFVRDAAIRAAPILGRHPTINARRVLASYIGDLIGTDFRNDGTGGLKTMTLFHAPFVRLSRVSVKRLCAKFAIENRAYRGYAET